MFEIPSQRGSNVEESPEAASTAGPGLTPSENASCRRSLDGSLTYERFNQFSL
jgi:hypothetical protein